MKLTDSEILELNDLSGAVVDGTLTDAQRARLQKLLRESDVARRHYVRALGQSASLHHYAAEMHADAPDRLADKRYANQMAWWAIGSFAAAAAIVVGLWLIRAAPPADGRATAKPFAQFVAQITGARQTQWAKSSEATVPGARLRQGQRVELTAGYAEITFDSGARVVLEGAASLDVNSAWEATLRRGTLKATVPPEAIGFRVSSAAVDVIDLGTEFTMIADATGAAEVLVHKGEVEAAPRGAAGRESILLRENESRRFAETGVSDVTDRERKFARFAQTLTLDRFSPTINYVHWSFDETSSEVANADVAGTTLKADAAQLRLGDVANSRETRAPGRFGGAMRFDGRLFAKAALPGISGSSPRTVSFWVRVPDGASSDAWMVSWGTHVRKLGSRPVQISWNRRPAEGPFGALRTDFGGGYAMGAQDLRDGRWHHIAVYFVAGEGADAPLQVKQYIDGRLESSTITLTPGKGGAALPGDAMIMDVVWLGCRLTGKQPERFRGEMDELFIADRALDPNEIVSLMKTNRLQVAGLVAK